MVGWNTKYIGGVDSSDSYIVDLVEIFLDLRFGHGLGDSENVGTYRMFSSGCLPSLVKSVMSLESRIMV